MDLDDVAHKVKRLLPNREAVRLYVWNNFTGPLPDDFHQLLIASIDEYGAWKEKHRKDGKLAFSGWAYKGKKQGRWIYFYRNGKPHKDCHYKNGERYGICTDWDLNGTYNTATYVKGKIDGEQLFYKPDGALQFIRHYKLGRWVNTASP